MATGHPDWQTWTGRSGGGESMISHSFQGEVAALSTGTMDLTVVGENQENLYQCISISSGEDGYIHAVQLTRISDSWLFFYIDFINSGIFDFPGQIIKAGEQVRVTVYNYAPTAITFIGTVNYTIRNV